ncbi:MAG: Cupin 4 [uncultured Friedmanniella sp.]|uniref:Cupin 4 n=1 Tax=uncultured Friedmanniella sp. TaxID=335381 RepID=A0A6J4JVK6_9ACTN|nr:cupin domain-containing protein [uncultured Friedmanniella sp.]CAA9288369.1 MAG: Cupin 4 [uncultured Friedmanniella sp.]
MNHTTSSADGRAPRTVPGSFGAVRAGTAAGAGGLRGLAGAPAGQAVLSRLVAVDPTTFADQHWGRRPLLSNAQDLPRDFGDLLSADAVDELVSTRGLRTPFLRVAKNGSTLAERSFTGPGGVGAGIADQVSDDKLVRLFSDGSTLVLQALHRVWPPVLRLCQQLAAELGHPVQANAYVTPPQNQGFSNHYDVHDVFVLQIEGEKRWQIHPPVLESPLRDQPWSDRKAAVAARAAEEPLIETVLRPGDCLYLPRGFLHAATALGGVSTHLTLGVHSWTRYLVAEQLLQQALRSVAEDPAIRGSLPLGVDLGEPEDLQADVEQVRAALVAALGATDLEQLSEVLHTASRGTSRAAPVGPLRQLRTADQLRPDTELVLRPHVAARLSTRDGQTVLRSRAADLPLTADEVPAVARLLDAGTATPTDLGEPLARRLVLNGLVLSA